MSLTTHGSIPVTGALQPRAGLTEHNDGTIQGHYITEGNLVDLDTLPRIGDPHPADNRAEITSRHIEYLEHRRVRITAECFGITEDPTPKQLQVLGTPDREQITSHPDFVSKLAGTFNAPITTYGAEFDAQGNFVGFTDSDSPLYGVQFWLKASTQVTLSWWTTKVPDLGQRMQIVDALPPFRKPKDVTNFLVIDLPYRKIGNHYQLTQLALGSGEGGFSDLIYPPPE